MFQEYILLPLLEAFNKYKYNNAFYFRDRYYSYSELAQTVSKIRKSIRVTKTASKNIGLVTNDDIETYASIIALWLEGFAYVPLHPLQPHDRNIEIINQAEVEIIIDSTSKSTFGDWHIIRSSTLKFESLDLALCNIDDENLAYILFTSGSTGKPKGIPITRGNIAAFINAFDKVGIKLDIFDRCLQCFDLTFDVSIQSFLFPLLKGACVYTVPIGEIKYSYAANLLDDHQLTFGAMAPSMVRFLKPYFDEINLTSLKYCILTAEASPLNLIFEWSKCVPNAEIFNFYGPTETTIYCTYYKYNKTGTNKEANGIISIGKPMHALTAIIIDENRNICKNEKGELCISGPQVTPGYLQNQEKNKVSFFEKEIEGFSRHYYRTGDLCSIDNNGDLLYWGRLDTQIKVQGYRVELGEIEYLARKYLKGKNVIGLAHNTKDGQTEIILFIESATFDTDNLNNYFSCQLPNYCIPSKIFFVEEMPLNTNAKIDRAKLKHYLEEIYG